MELLYCQVDGSLPHRQLRKLAAVIRNFRISSLPHRQLRKPIITPPSSSTRSLSHRQPRKLIEANKASIEGDQAQTANLKLRSQLMMEVSEYVKQSRLTQTEAAKRLGTTQPRLNDVLKGRIEKCTVDRLVNMLAAVGYKVNLGISHAV